MIQKTLSAKGRLSARPRGSANRPRPGLQPLSLRSKRDALLYVPNTKSNGEQPMPLVVSLHGAGGNERHGMELLQAQAEAHGVILLSPASRLQSWDVIMDGFGPDVEFLDTALERTFALCQIDAARVAISGFSDGASYALTLGLTNGDLFTDILAFSPGFTAHSSTAGKPRIFVSHGMRDTVLPIERCSRRLVPKLKAAGYDVDYREFEGPHTVPPEMSAAAFAQLLDL